MSQTVGHQKSCGLTSMKAALTACPLVMYAVITCFPWSRSLLNMDRLHYNLYKKTSMLIKRNLAVIPDCSTQHL